MTETEKQTDPKKPLIFKFEYDGQQYELASLTSTDTVADLRAVICSMLSIDDFKRVNIKTLQPTRIIDCSDDSRALVEIFRQTRERIVVEDIGGTAGSSSHQATSLNHHFKTFQNNLSERRNSPPRLPSSSGIKHRKSELTTSPETNTANAFDEANVDRYNRTPSPSANYVHSTPSLAQTDESPIRQRKLPRNQTDYPVCSSTGYLLRHPVPSNNSCLFTSVHFCLTHGVVDPQIGKSMRKIIAETVASDKEHFDHAFLGKSNEDYCNWILDDNNWGGAIELSILCKHFEIEIVAIDVKNTLLHNFGKDSHYQQKMLLLYDGIHYDPLKFQPLDDNQPIQTLFSSDNTEVLTMAEELANEAKQSHQFTDIKSIVMSCSVCGAEFDAKNASEHASRTGHVEFVEKNSR